MDVDADLVRHVARLAHLALGEEEVAELAGQLAALLAYVDRIRAVPAVEEDADGPGPIGPDGLRADRPAAPLERAVVLRNAPDHDGRYVRVPPFLRRGPGAS